MYRDNNLGMILAIDTNHYLVRRFYHDAHWSTRLVSVKGLSGAGELTAHAAEWTLVACDVKATGCASCPHTCDSRAAEFQKSEPVGSDAQ